MRALWLAASSSRIHTGHMTRTTTVTASVGGATRFIGSVLLLTLPFAVALATETASIRNIDVELSRYAFSPQRIEVRLGEQVRLNVVSIDGTHGFQVKELGLNVRIPADGKTVTVALTPNEAGTFTIRCSEYCGRGHSRMKASLIVTPGT